MTPHAPENLTAAANEHALTANLTGEWISASLVARTMRYLVSRGCDAQVLAAAADVDLSGDFHALSERRVPRAALEALFAAADRILGEPGIGVQFAATAKLTDYQVMGYAVMTATSAREALRRAARYSALFTNSYRWELELEGPVGKVRAVRRHPAYLGRLQSTECALAEFLHCFRSSTGAPIPSPVTRFAHTAPRDTSAQRAFFGGVLLYGQAEDSFTFDTAVLSRPPRDANPELADYFARVAERQLAQDTAESLAAHVRRTIARDLTSGLPPMATVARRLAMSERTLRRRLADEGTTWADVVDGYRRDEAARLLAQSQSVTDTAYLLGFSDISAFSRAYRRWYGALPSGRRLVARRS